MSSAEEKEWKKRKKQADKKNRIIGRKEKEHRKGRKGNGKRG